MYGCKHRLSQFHEGPAICRFARYPMPKRPRSGLRNGGSKYDAQLILDDFHWLTQEHLTAVTLSSSPRMIVLGQKFEALSP